MRILLTNYLRDAEQPADINELDTGPIASARYVFDESVGVEASDLTAREIDRYRPRVYDQISESTDETLYLKVHDAFTFNNIEQPLFSKQATKGALYLVRNPLDVAVSFAHHWNRTVEKMVCSMGDSSFSFVSKEDRLHKQLSQRLLTWSEHVTSWVDNPEFNVHVVRYEDMKATPEATFTDVIRYIGLDDNPARIQKAVDYSQFEKLSQQEQKNGFRERPKASESFFRKGEVGSWREQLSADLVERLIEDHGEIMQRFGYLTETAELCC